MANINDVAAGATHIHEHTHLHHNHAAVSENDHSAPLYLDDSSPKRDTVRRSNSHDHMHHAVPEAHANHKGDFNVADVEKGEIDRITPVSSTDGTPRDSQEHVGWYRKYRVYIHVTLFLLATAWWAASLALHRNDKNWVIPFLLWLAFSLRLLTLYVPVRLVMNPVRWVWRNTCVRATSYIPEKWRTPLAAAGTVAVILVGSFVSKENADNTRENRAVSLFGLAVLIASLWATSRNRKAINWHTVISGMLIQYVVALFVLRTSVGYDIFNFISGLARSLLGFAGDGVSFLTSADVLELGWFLIGVLPAIIFFVSLVQLMYYVGLVQWFIGKFAVFFFWAMRISGAESVVAAATPFIGQGESAMLIKPFVAHLTMCELHQVMCSGFATIAGSVLVAYIGMGLNPQALISSCVMSIPASLAVSKLRYPEEEESLTAGKVVVPNDDENQSANALHAFANGAWLGLKIAGMILCTLLCIIAFVALINGLLTWFGHYLNLTGEYDLTIELILGYLFYPIAFLLGVPRGPDLLKVSRLIGIKVVTNEFVAFNALTTDPLYAGMSPRSKLIATYSLCGFGNIGSLGTQIGVLSQIAPSRGGDVSKLAMSALITGVLSTLSSASIAGLVIQDQTNFI
ncbi:hypothetical protein LTR56_003035 [Elasticomyces elasticus]|nr:hypothetical protein LTR56_003035 [Elasticomyces elasticus]KAK3662098.1 hypothetical protein LTR22_007070 [Elasticomyces elasticus]KAK4927539.1 hypothetical protein LTR49_005680 [Elasticomyces elasticus]KAK5753248.1 hypothetical protein LTS12_016715 [Elasticomyces elasticus]